MERIGNSGILLSMLNLAEPTGGGEATSGRRTTQNTAGGSCTFGGAGQRVSVPFAALSALTGSVWQAWDECDSGIAVPRSTVQQWRKNQALVEVALTTALNVVPTPCIHGGLIFDIGNGRLYRVRRVRRSGDCFIDVRESGKWRWMRVDALHMLGEILGKEGDFKAVLAFVQIVEAELERRNLFAVSPWARVSSRVGLLKLQAGHKGLQEQTRLLLALVWSAANGEGFDIGEARDLARLAKVAKIGMAVARRKLARLAKALPAMMRFEAMDWAAFTAWSAAAIDAAKVEKVAVQFRVCFSLWRACLTREDGAWRWRGFHDFYRHGRGGLAHKVARQVGCSKGAAAAALATLMLLGFLVKSGLAICLAAGWWGKTIVARVAKVATIHLPQAIKRIANRLVQIFCPVPSPHPTQ